MKPDFAIEIIRRLRDKGHEAYLVGGCVRDMVMNLEPSDYDIATGALPAEIMKIFPHTQPVGVQFGVVLVIHHGHPFEVATFRSDEAYVDGRRPTGVVFTDARTDVLRRDFTINGLLYDPFENRVIDYVSGEEDIRNRIIRAIGDPLRRFEEDKLRLLRAVRFGARLGYAIEPSTWDAVCRMAGQIRLVSTERICGELMRMLTEGRAAHAFRLLQESGLLREILPQAEWNAHLERCLERIPANAAPDFGFGVLLHDVPAETVRQIAEGLRFSRSEAGHTVSLAMNLPQFRNLRSLPVSALKRLLRMPRAEDHLELSRICATASGASLDDYHFAIRMRRTWTTDEIAPRLLVSGDDLIVMGLSPGPLFKEILVRVEDEQLEGRLTSREQAIEFIRGNFSK